ncbi:hypothetical protein [Rheinheimera sp.]|uniref:hypothetical protein n=1 Tax=Rheinheimera sp. TaxID=1869214 RepID=UPI00307EE472
MKQQGFVLICTLILGAVLIMMAGAVLYQSRLSLAMASAGISAQQQLFRLHQQRGDMAAAPQALVFGDCPADYAAWSEPLLRCATTSLVQQQQQFAVVSLVQVQQLAEAGDERL